MQNDYLVELAQKLGIAAGGLDVALKTLEKYGGFAEPYPESSDDNEVLSLAKIVRQARMELDVYMGTLPKKQEAIYGEYIERIKRTAEQL